MIDWIWSRQKGTNMGTKKNSTSFWPEKLPECHLLRREDRGMRRFRFWEVGGPKV